MKKIKKLIGIMPAWFRLQQIPNLILYTNAIPFSDNLDDNNGVLMPEDDSAVVNMYATDEF